MPDKSILEQIINSKKAEEVANFNAYEIVSNLFNELNERERDVLSRRFGLEDSPKETLEKIGESHKLTRERIRQIENSGIHKLKESGQLGGYAEGFKRVIMQLLEDHGGLMEKEYLISSLASLSALSGGGQRDIQQSHRNYLDFLIAKLLSDEFEETSSANFKSSFRLKYQDISYLEEIAAELENKIKEIKTILTIQELINLAKELNSYQQHESKLPAASNVDLSYILGLEHGPEEIDLINANKAIYSILQAARRIEKNRYGQWGIYDWREVKPKTINDKIFLILKNHGQPLHFADIAGKINEIGFDHKKANPATVHNELILDKKYVLVGRGLYGLKDWGYEQGTVADVIKEILTQAAGPLTREEIIKKTMDKRLVKKTTIILALMNKDLFDRTEDGKYRMKG